MSDLHLAVIQPSDDVEPGERVELARELSRSTGAEVRFGRHDRMLYSTDASIYQVEPIGVVLPRRINDLPAIVEFARERDLAMLPRGGGTSLAGQAVNRAIVVDLSKHCRDIVSVDAAKRTCLVEPGVVLDQLNRALAPAGLMFAPDVATATQATIGGMIGNNSAGAHSILYGRTVDHLLAIDALLPSGERLSLHEGARDEVASALARQAADIVRAHAAEIRARFPRILRRVDGYNLDLLLDQIERSTASSLDRVNLATLLCGSEGTLAWTMHATLRLTPVPAARGLAIIAYPDVEAAIADVAGILPTRPAAVELIDDVVIGMASRNTMCREAVGLLPSCREGCTGAVLYVAYFGDSQSDVADGFARLERVVVGRQVQRHTDPEAMGRAWLLRRSGEPLLHAIPGARKPVTFIEDTAVDPTRLGEFVRAFRTIVERHGTRAAYYAHASVGCLHIRPLIDLRSPDDVGVMQAISREVADLVVQFGGSLSGEHGDGRVRSHLLDAYFGPVVSGAMREIKRLFDPKGLMNPGVIVEPPAGSMVEHWRVRPEARVVRVPEVDTYFRYDHGFGEAVEQCNGAGVCRKTIGGTMCPSYRATLDERHSTRGRGNALRLAITGQFGRHGRAEWNDAETLATLDLCLSCKACKTECPSNVDIAKLKAEFRGQHHRMGLEATWSERVMAEVRWLNRIGSAMAPVANMIGSLAPARRVTGRMFDVHPGRSLPKFERSLHRWMNGRTNAGAGPAVILLPDCFTVFNEPSIGRDAVRVLERLGYRVVLPRLGCCGRPMISLGFMDRARRVCAATATALRNEVERSRAIAVLGIEPSCVSAIRDDWLDLKMDVDAARVRDLAARTLLVEEFVETWWDRHPHRPPFTPDPAAGDVVLHAHCHQKALWGADTTAALLRRALGAARVTVLDSGCCGMAGAFGYSTRRFDLSMRIAEHSLFGALRSQPAAQVAATGTSCRHQIRDGLARHSDHPVTLVARSMGIGPDGIVHDATTDHA
jgi:FAD/FMN-containing dehydrogenase/Fe-S oxidoreductase